MATANRTATRKLLLTATALLLASVGWVLFGGGPAPPPAPVVPPAPAAPAPSRPVITEAAAAELRPLPGEGTLVVELRYLGASQETSTLVSFAGELSGTVYGDQGQPVPGASLRVRGGPQDGLTAAADAAGAFRMLGLLPGTHLFEIGANGLTAARQQRILSRAPTRRDFFVGLPIGLLIEVRGHDAKPLAGATVDVGLGRQILETDEEGHVFFPAVPRGPRVLVGARAPGHVPLRIEMNLMPRNPGPDPVVIDLPKAGRIRGQVSSWPGPPLPTITVVPREDRPGSYSVAWDTWHQVPVGADGRFELDGLPTTRLVDVRVFHPRGVAEPPLFSVKPGAATPSTVRFNILRRDTRIAGRVVDPAGAGVGGALVVLEAADPAAVLGRLYPGLAEGPVSAVLPTPAALRRELRSASDGGFDFDYGDHPKGSGNLVLRASKEGYATARSLVRNARSNFSLVLRPVERASTLLLKAANSAPMPPVEWFLDGARTGGDGPELGPLLEGHYEISVVRGELVLEPVQVVYLGRRLEIVLG